MFSSDPTGKGRHYSGAGGELGEAVILGLGWSGQDQFEFVQEEREFRLRLFGIAGQQQLAAVGRRDMQIDHLHGGELFDGAARGQTGRQGMQPPAKRDVQTIGEEGDEDMRLDAPLILVKDRPNGEVAFDPTSAV